MAKDVITRFRLENNGFDSKIKQAAKTLSDLGKSATAAGKDFQEVTKGSVEAARAFGSIQTSSNNAKDRLKELTGAFNEVAKAYNSLTKEQQKSDWAKAMADSLTQLQQRIKDTKTELQGLGTEGGIFSKMGDKLGGAMSVFAGNLMTKATMEVANLGSEMTEMVKQGVELARQGEGIRIAFERIGRGDLLDGLRQATHGTITDLELMKAAVRFDDFKLPLDQLGTMLAFAQQKAKDTGQSFDYMVDSIVTGLGRQSPKILDNLGLSITEIHQKTKETGDMTKAVGEIIREQMQKAGDYVETAADRAAQANVDLQNKLEELGRKFLPVQEASNQLWTSMKISILDIVGGPLARLLNGLTEAGRLRNQMNDMAGGNSSSETEKQLNFLRKTSAGKRQARYDRQIGIYNAQESNEWRRANRAKANLDKLKNAKPGTYDPETYASLKDSYQAELTDATRKAQAWQNFRINYQKGAQGILNPVKEEPPKVEPPKTGTGGTGGSTSGKTTAKDVYVPAEGSIDAQVEKVRELTKQWSAATDQAGRDGYKKQLDEAQGILDQMRGKAKAVTQEMATGISGLTPDMIKWGENDIKQQMQSVEYGTQEYNDLAQRLIDYNSVSNLMQEAVKMGLEVDDSVKEEFVNSLTGPLGENVPKELYDSLVESLNEFKEYAGENPIELNTTTGNIRKLGEDAKFSAQEFGNAASAVSQLGSALTQIEDPTAKVAGMIAQAIATIALTFAKSLEKTFSPWDWIAAAAAGTATMVSTIAAIKSSTAQGYAEGGIIDGSKGGFVQGNTYSGDQVGNVRLNAGELVLNRAQQGVLADALDNEGGGAISSTPYVTGEQIYLGLNNYLKGAGLGQIVTSQG